MKKQIDWLEIKSSDEFQSLCNKVLHWEVSKHAVPFGAKGKDKGTDGQFQGTFAGKTGEWRFQYKFHDPTMDNSKARSLVKSEFKKELETIKNEKPDFYVFMTNVKLTKALHDDLMSIAARYDFEARIWDGEKLEAILVKHPFIIAYHFGVDLPLFEPYQERFKAELEGSRPILNHIYSFQGRGDELSLVEKLTSDENIKLMLVSGGSGIGKTRLAIESAKKIEESEVWTSLIVRNEADNFDDHLLELSAQNNYVIILDDAESYPHIKKLISLANRQGWSEKLKLLLITKPQNHEEIKKLIFPQLKSENVAESNLTKLSNQETLNLLSELGIKDDIVQRALFPICKDSPILTVMTAKLYQDGIKPEKLSQEEIITTSFEKNLDNLKIQGKKSHIKFLEILAAVSPIGIRNQEEHEKISEMMKIPIEDEQDIIQDLIKKGLIETRGGSLRVIPNMLSDYILGKKCFDDTKKPTGFHKKILNEFLQTSSKRVLRNFAALEFKTGQKLLTDFAEEIIGFIPQADNLQRSNILESLEDFAYYRPLDTLEIIDQIMKNPQPTTKVPNEYLGEFEITNEEVMNKIPSLLKKTAYTLETLPTALNHLKNIALTEDGKDRVGNRASALIKEICEIRYGRDIWISEERKLFYYDEKWHEAFLKILSEWLKKGDEKLQLMSIELLGNLLKMECRYTRTSLENRAQFIFTTIPIARTENWTKFRDKLLTAIEQAAERIASSNVKAAIYASLGETLREILMHQRKKDDKIDEDEKNRIIKFLMNMIEKESNLRALNKIESSLRYLKWAKDDDKKNLIGIEDEFEKLPGYKLFKYLVGSHNNWDEFDEPDFWKNFADNYSKKYNQKELSNVLLRVLDEAEQGWFYGGVATFLFSIGEYNTDYGLKLLYLILKNKSRLLDYVGYLLGGIRISNDEEALKYIYELKTEDDIRFKKAVVVSYDRLKDYDKFTQNDMDILKELSATDDDKLKMMIAEVIRNLYQVSIKDYLEILKIISAKPTVLVASKISDAIVRPKIEFTDEDFEKIKSIAANFSEIDDLDDKGQAFYHIEGLFRQIIGKDPEWIIEFFEKRLKLANDREKENVKYVAIPYFFSQTFKDLKEHAKYKDVLRRVRDWMEKEGWFNHEAPSLLRNLCASESHETRVSLNSDVEEILTEWVNSGEKQKMINAAELLREFSENERFYRIVQELIIKSDGNLEVMEILSSSILSSGGTIIRSHGQASPTHVRRIDYLKRLRDSSDNIKVKRFSEKEIEYAQAEIRRDLERDESLES